MDQDFELKGTDEFSCRTAESHSSRAFNFKNLFGKSLGLAEPLVRILQKAKNTAVIIDIIAFEKLYGRMRCFYEFS